MNRCTIDSLIFSVGQLRNIEFNELYHAEFDSSNNLNILETVIVSVLSGISLTDTFTYNSIQYQSDRTILQELERKPNLSCGIIKLLLQYSDNGMISEQTQTECYKSTLQLGILFLGFSLEFQTIIQPYYQVICSKIKLKDTQTKSLVVYENIFLAEMKTKIPQSMYSEIGLEVSAHSCTNLRFWANDPEGKELFDYITNNTSLQYGLLIHTYINWLKMRFNAKDLKKNNIFITVYKMQYLFKQAVHITNNLMKHQIKWSDENNTSVYSLLEKLFQLLAIIQIRFISLDDYYSVEGIIKMFNAINDHIESTLTKKMNCSELIGYPIKLVIVALFSYSYMKPCADNITHFFKVTLTQITNNIIEIYPIEQSVILYKQYIKLCCDGLEADTLYLDYHIPQLHESLIEIANNNFDVYLAGLEFCSAIIQSPFRTDSNLIFSHVKKVIENFPQQIASHTKTKLCSLLLKVAVQCIWNNESIIDSLIAILDILLTIASVPIEFDSTEREQLIEMFVLNILKEIGNVMKIIPVCCKVLIDAIQAILKLTLSDKETYPNLKIGLECVTALLANIRSKQHIEVIIQHGLQFLKLIMECGTTKNEFKILFNTIVKKFLTDANIECIQLASIACKKLVEHVPQDRIMVKQLFFYLIINSRTSVIRDIYLSGELILGTKYLWGFHKFMYTYCNISDSGLLIGISNKFTDILVLLEWAFQIAQPLEVQLEEYTIANAKNFRNGIFTKGLKVPIYEAFSDLLKIEQMDTSLLENFYDTLLVILFMAVIFPNSSSLLEISKHTLIHNALNIRHSIQKQNNLIIYSVMKRLIHINSLVSYKLERDLIEILKCSVTLSDAKSIITTLGVNIGNKEANQQLEAANKLDFQASSLFQSYQQSRCVDSYVNLMCSCVMLKSHIEMSCTSEYKVNQSQIESLKLLNAHYRDFVMILKSLGVGAIWFSNRKLNLFEVLTRHHTISETQARIMHVKQKVLTLLEKCESQLVKKIIIQTCRVSQKVDSLISSVKVDATTNNCDVKIKLQLFTSFNDCINVFNNIEVNSPLKEIGSTHEGILELALRVDRGIVLISDCVNGKAIECNELYFMNEGVYLNKSSKVKVGINTTNIWKELFSEIFRQNKQIRAIIMPKGHPNMETWEELRKDYEPEVLSSILTWNKDYQYSWRGYEARPRIINGRQDIVLRPRFNKIQNNYSENIKLNLTSIISNYIIKCIADKYHTSIYTQQPQAIIQYIVNKMQTSSCSQENISENTSEAFFFPHLVSDINSMLENWILSVDLNLLFANDIDAFFELKNYLEISDIKKNRKYGHIRSQIKLIVSSCLYLFRFTDLPKEVQFQIMHWIDQIESSMWIETESTEKAYISLLTNSDYPNLDPFPGFVYFFLPEYKIAKNVPKTNTVLTCDRMIAYVIGQNTYLDLNDDPLKNANFRRDNWKLGERVLVYEVVGTWVSPKFRKLNISVEIYRKIFLFAPSKYIVLDAIQDTQGKLSLQTRLGVVLNWFKVKDLVLNQVIMREVVSTWNTYLVKDDRKFKRFLVNLTALRVLIRIDDTCNIFSNIICRAKSGIFSIQSFVTLLFFFLFYFTFEKSNLYKLY